jgi:MYXO-CTERM domain-containing protein
MLTLYSYQIQAQDTDSTDILYYALRKAPEGVSFDISTGLLTWTPAENDAETKVSITVAACDLEDACVEQSWELPVSRNRPPQIRSTPGNKAWSGQEYTYQMDAVDPDTGDILSYKMTKGPASIKVDTKTGLMTWTPTEDDSKEAVDLVMEVCDQDDVCVPQDWKVEVDIPNKPPQITSTPTDSIVAGMTYQYDIKASDPNAGDTVTLKLKQAPPSSVIEGSKLTWKSTSTDVGEHSFQVEACDKEGLCVEQRWSITVEAPPTEPTSSEPTVDAGPTDGGNTTDEPPKQVGCSVSGTTGGSSGGWLVLFAWLVLFVRRRQVSLSN